MQQGDNAVQHLYFYKANKKPRVILALFWIAKLYSEAIKYLYKVTLVE